MSESSFELRDTHAEYPVTHSSLAFAGKVFSLYTDQVDFGVSQAQRDYVSHPGAVAIVPWRESGDSQQPEILLINQYRHPVRAMLWEIPAGLMDHPGEDPLSAARRELLEEANLEANQWDVLVDYFTSPGGSSEALRVFLARDLHEIEESRRDFVPEDEEAFMTQKWVSLDKALAGIYAGRIHNPSAVVGILAAALAQLSPQALLRSPQSEWMR